MRKWERVSYRERCGQCGKLLAKNEPVLAITLNGVQRTLWRCGECAGPVPPDLPDRIETESLESKIERLKDLGLKRTAADAMPEASRREWLAYKDD